MFTALFQLNGGAVHMKRAAVEPGFDNEAIRCEWLGHKRAHLKQLAQAKAV